MPSETGVSGASGASSGGGGGGGDASEAKQDAQILQLADILTEVTGAAKDTSVQDVTTAIEALGDGGTIAEVVALLVDDGATQDLILVKLGEIGIDADASAASLVAIAASAAAIDTNTDGVEGLITATNTKLAGGLPAALVSDRLDVNVGASVLPSGAATAAKQPALGVAGTASTDVITVQGIASGVAQPVDTELPAAAALSDTTANPTAPMVGSGLMLWNSGGNVWRRAAGLSSAPQVLAIGNAGFASLQIAAKTSGSVWTDVLCHTTGHLRIMSAGESPIAADATTDVWARVPAGNGRTAATSGVGAILASAGRLRSARATMTNANNVWIAFHNAATATTATEANMLAGPWNVSGVGAYVNYEPPIVEACTAGCKVVAWTDATMTTIDTAATFTFYARAM